MPSLMTRSCRHFGAPLVATSVLGFKSYSAFSACEKSSYSPVSLKEKTVLITGATAGIGEACAWRFAGEGAKLILVGRRTDRLLSLKAELQEAFIGCKVHVETLSVTDTAAVSTLPARLPSEFASVDILVNNAGLALGVSSVESNVVADAETMLATNVLGTIAMCSAFLPGMKARGCGHVVNMGSIAGHSSYATGSVYNATKFAVLGFTSAARHDLVGTPIRVTHISPGMVGSTEFSNVRLGDAAKAKLVYENIAALHPNDVADNVIYAVSVVWLCTAFYTNANSRIILILLLPFFLSAAGDSAVACPDSRDYYPVH